MVSSIGIGLGRNPLINGFGYHPHHVIRRRTTRGRGVRTTAGSVVRNVGHIIVDKLAGAIAGSGYKLAGGRKKRHAHHIRLPRSTLGMGRKRKVHHRILF